MCLPASTTTTGTVCIEVGNFIRKNRFLIWSIDVYVCVCALFHDCFRRNRAQREMKKRQMCGHNQPNPQQLQLQQAANHVILLLLLLFFPKQLLYDCYPNYPVHNYFILFRFFISYIFFSSWSAPSRLYCLVAFQTASNKSQSWISVERSKKSNLMKIAVQRNTRNELLF